MAVRKLIEDKANGPAVVDMLKMRLPGLMLVNPEGGKESRASAMEPFHQGGNLWLPDPAGCEWPDGNGGWRPLDTSWVEKFMYEFERFPKGVNDDQVDMLSQAVTWWLEVLQAARPIVELVAVGRGGPSPWRYR
jgi:phage terminase large subunit-like protein